MSIYNPLHLLPLPPTPLDPKPIPTALSIDPFSDTLWLGTSTGLVSAFCSPLALSPNVRFPAHGARQPGYHPAGVREFRVTDREVWTLTEGGVGGRKRGGAVRWSVSDPMRGACSMCGNPTNSHEVVVGGSGGGMVANTSRGEVVRRFDTPSSVVKLAGMNRSVVCASLSGQVSILDPRVGFKSSTQVAPVQAHTGGLNGADVQGNLICTWGWTHMSGHPLPDPLVRLYDVRALRALPPISFPAGPAFCLLHPTDPSKLVISSSQGALQLFDMSSGSAAPSLQQLDVNSYVTAMAMSPMGDYLAFGDGDGQLHLWTTHETGEGAPTREDGSLALSPFNGYEGVKPEWPDAAEPPAQVAWDDKTPLNAIGMPYYSEPLLSNFAAADYAPPTSPFFNPPEPIPASVLGSMKMVDFVGYATMPRELRGKRYVVTARPGAGKRSAKGTVGGRRESAPRFRSEKDRNGGTQHTPTLDAEEESTAPGEIPKYYRKVEIKYSKFGIEDFDFGFYNRTAYSGLETDILNSYTNALLQALHYTQPVRAVAKAHICVDCKKEHCLLCEAGFLFRMLEDARGINCQASNFSRAFSATPQASALGLMDDNEKSTAPYGSLIQNFNRWLLSTLSAEAVVDGETFDVKRDIGQLGDGEKPSAMDQVLGIETRTTNTCQACGAVSEREATLHAVDLAYPKKPSESPSFAQLLRSSIIRETSTRATCSSCKQFAPLESRRLLASLSLPPVLSVNAMVNAGEVFDVWRDRGEERFLPLQISFKVSDRDLAVASEGEGVTYEIRSMVVQVQEKPEVPAHLLCFAKVDDGWVMFNDFCVRPVSDSEVFSFPDQWKVPAVVVLERIDATDVLDLAKLPKQLDPEVLFKDVSIAWNRRKNLIKHTVLEPTELPGKGTLIAIDAEFVALQQEEMEFRSDGTKNILRPSHMSLARVSVLRGEGEMEEVPFIDDYIHTSESVVDYLTEFSGIKNGDLDPNNSPHTLVPLKVAYKKLRLLVDLGCTFIGHGLAKDFRTINIFVPPEQVMDTVNIYTIEGRQRKLSLRFLTWYVLKKDIQTHTHDSIEDAKYALLLYRKYLEYEEEGRFEDVMEEIFKEGQVIGFKPPQDRPPSPANFPPLRPGASPAGSRTPSNQHLHPHSSSQWSASPAFVPHPRRRHR